MKVATIQEPYKFEFSHAQTPEISDDEVLLKVNCLGICGSDMQIYKGLHKYMTLPVVPGHEFVATVVRQGKAVRGFQTGDRVTMDPKITCGHCWPCSIGRPNACESLKVMGVHAPGAACEYIVGKTHRMHKIPSQLSDAVAVLNEPLAVAVGSLNNCGQALRDANIAVIGAGTIGNLTAQAAKAMGARQVMLCDIDLRKLKMAEGSGVEHLVDLKETSLKEAIRARFGAHRQADIIVDCSGAAPSFQAILDASRGSSLIVITGSFKEPVPFEIPRIQRRDIRIIGSHMYTEYDFAQALQLLEQGSIYVRNFISAQFQFTEIDKAFQYTAEHPERVLKTMVVF